MDEFVIGFIEGEPDGLTPIDVVMDVTELTYEEVKSCCEVVTIPEPEPEFLDLGDVNIIINPEP